MTGSERWKQIIQWCGDHGKFTAIVIALTVGLIVGFWWR